LLQLQQPLGVNLTAGHAAPPHTLQVKIWPLNPIRGLDVRGALKRQGALEEITLGSTNCTRPSPAAPWSVKLSPPYVYNLLRPEPLAELLGALAGPAGTGRLARVWAFVEVGAEDDCRALAVQLARAEVVEALGLYPAREAAGGAAASAALAVLLPAVAATLQELQLRGPLGERDLDPLLGVELPALRVLSVGHADCTPASLLPLAGLRAPRLRKLVLPQVVGGTWATAFVASTLACALPLPPLPGRHGEVEPGAVGAAAGAAAGPAAGPAAGAAAGAVWGGATAGAGAAARSAAAAASGPDVVVAVPPGELSDEQLELVRRAVGAQGRAGRVEVRAAYH
jgi:hypothetical protein